MHLNRHIIAITTALGVLVLAGAACGSDANTALDTLPPIRTTTTIFVPETTIDTTRYFYKIQPGDNLNRIAQDRCVPLTELIAINRDVLPDPNNVPAGATIEIPQGVAMEGCVPASSIVESDG